MALARVIVTDALIELTVIADDESPSANAAALVLRKLERLLNQWNAQRQAVYADVFSQFTLTPSLNPHTIGPTGATFTVTQRPVSIEGISLILDSSDPDVYLPMNKRDAAWWQSQITPTIEVTYPTDFYYDPTWIAASPNGSIYFWPVPSQANDVQIRLRNLLTDSLTLDTNLSLPPGYQEALTLTLAEKCARTFGKPLAQDLQDDARQARAIIYANNDVTPTIETRDGGMEGPRGGNRSNFNWLTGGPAH